jgi:hypothetical protein
MLALPYREVWAIDTEFNFRPTAAHMFPADHNPTVPFSIRCAW